MTYHMEKTMSWVRSVELNPIRNEDKLSMQFPWKLWQAVNAPDFLLMWNEEETGFTVNPTHFEASVMQTHPGLVVIPTFANFRRQLREYGFDWTHCKEAGDYTFTHPCFVPGRQDLLNLVLTRRKSRFVNRGEGNDRSRLSSTRRSTRRGRSYHSSLVSPRRESVNLGSLSNRSVSRIVPEPSSSNQLCSLGGHGCRQMANFRNIRLRNLEAEPRPGPSRVEQWISLVPSSSSYSGFGVPVPASSGKQEKLTQRWFDPFWSDADQSKEEENSWWSECFPSILQQDSDLCRQFEIDNLSSAVFQQSLNIGIPLHFYPDSFHAIPVTTATYPSCLESSGTSGGFYDHAPLSGEVIEIKPIADDADFPDV